ERGDAHVLTLHVGTDEQASDALEALSLALDALSALPAFTAPAPTPITRKAPTPPANMGLSKAEVKAAKFEERQAIIDKARAERAALSVASAPVTRNPAPAKATRRAAELDW